MHKFKKCVKKCETECNKSVFFPYSKSNNWRYKYLFSIYRFSSKQQVNKNNVVYNLMFTTTIF